MTKFKIKLSKKIKPDKNALLEERSFSSLEEESKKFDHARQEHWKNVTHQALIYFFRLISILMGIVVFVYFWHLVFPPLGWLTDSQIEKLKDLLFGGAMTIVWTEVKKRISSSKEE